jgi:hypothetical protein
MNIVQFKPKRLQARFCCQCAGKAEFFVEIWNVDTQMSAGFKYFCAVHKPADDDRDGTSPASLTDHPHLSG